MLQRFALISPFEGFSHRAIEVIDEFKDAGFELSFADEIGSSEQLTNQDTEPNLDLIEPGTMLGGEVKHNFMTGVTQELRSRLHRLENARFPFDSQINLKPLRLRHKPNQRFRLMNVEAIHQQVPLESIGVSCNQVLDMAQIVCLSAGIANSCFDHSTLSPTENSVS